MKRFIKICGICLVIVMFITGCSQAKTPSATPDYFTVLGLDWGITEQQALETLGVQEQDVGRGEGSSGDITIDYTPEQEIFGAKPEHVLLYFGRGIKSNQVKLYKIEFLYMGIEQERTERLKEEISQAYGPLKDEVITGAGDVQAIQQNLDVPPSVNKKENVSAQDGYWWCTETTLFDGLNAGQIKSFQTDWVKQSAYWENDEYFQLYVQNTPLVRIDLTEYPSRYKARPYPDGITVVKMDGSSVLLLKEYT